MRTCAIINPAASQGRAMRVWERVVQPMQAALGPVEAAYTSGPLAATALAREAIEGGAELVVSIGGDGTLNEVVNGYLNVGEALRAKAALGMIMAGTGGDFRRTLGLPRGTEEQLQRLLAGNRRRLDAGRLVCARLGGGEELRYFQNIASFGLSGATDLAVNSLTLGKWLGGKVAFQWGMLKALLRYRNRRVRIQVDDHFDETLRISTAAVCNGQYFGGGMRVAPRAQPDDGLLEVVIVGDVGKVELLRRVNAVYTGTHLEMEQVRVTRGRRVVATPAEDEGPVLIDCDGEVAGCLPAVFEVQPGALCLQV